MRDFLSSKGAYSLVLSFFLSVSVLAQHSSTQQMPNIVFYISDDLSASDISIYNHRGIEVPNIAALADNGLIFKNAFIASPSCAPSRAALLTGLYPNNNGALANHTYPSEGIKRLPPILAKLGYKIASFGKVDHHVNEESAELNGFDIYNKRPTGLPQQVRDFFKEDKGDQPICLLVGDRRPHVKWIDKADYPEGNISLPDYFLDTKETREHWARYATDVQGMDHDLGEVLAMAKARFGDNYIFLFSADHGSQWPFGKWNLYDYGINVPLVISWPGTIKPNTQTDALVSWIDIFPTLIDVAGGEVPQDIDGKSFHTLLKNPERDFRQYIFTAHTGDGDYNVFPIRSVRTERYKYIENLFPENYHTNHSDILRKDGAGAYWDSWDSLAVKDPAAALTIKKYHSRPRREFYDLKNDPSEQDNLIGETLFSKEISTLTQLLHQEYVNQNDKFQLLNEPWPKSGYLPRKPEIDARKMKRDED